MSPLINTEGQFAWTNTCENCWAPPKQPIFTDLEELECEWVWPEHEFVQTASNKWRCVSLPDRCKPCGAKYRRKLRMRKRVQNIMDLCEEMPKKYQVPKLITFALPCDPSPTWEDRWRLQDSMEKMMKKGRKILEDNGVKGGVYVIETTSRLCNLDRYPEGWMQWKHHPHVHMVGIAPYVHHSKLASWCEQLMEIGLGRIDYEPVRVRNWDGEINYQARRKVSDYIIKYLTKNKKSARSWGILRKGQKGIQELKS